MMFTKIKINLKKHTIKKTRLFKIFMVIWITLFIAFMAKVG